MADVFGRVVSAGDGESDDAFAADHAVVKGAGHEDGVGGEDRDGVVEFGIAREDRAAVAAFVVDGDRLEAGAQFGFQMLWTVPSAP